MPGLLDRALNYRLPLGEAQLGPGPMLGIRGPTVNNLLSPFTDVRNSDQMLPPDFSLAELGGLLGKLPQAFDPGALAREQVEAQTTPADPDQPYSAFKRLVNLFPMVEAFVGGAAAPAVAKGSTTLGTYAGRKAAKADPAALALAEARHAAGEAAGPASQIRQDTGWFKDAVGDWKWEFSDQPSKLTGKTGPTAADVLDHPEFFANYPRLAKAKVKIVDLHKMMGRPVNAAFHNQTGTIYLHQGLTPDEMRSKLQHELQHAVQKEENFATGSSTGEPPITTLADAELATSTNPKVQSYRALKKQIEAQRDAWIKKNIPQMGAKKATAAWPNIFPSEAQDLAGFTRALEGEAQNIRNRLYTNTFGEVEARDVEHRLNLDMDQRKASVPYVSQGVPESDYVRLRNDPGKPFPKVIPDESIPPGASATPPVSGPLEEKLFTGPNAMFQAIEQYKTWGGKGYGRVENRGADGWAAVREGTGPGALPPAAGGNAGLAPGGGTPAAQPVPPTPSVDRRGLPGRDPVGPRTPRTYRDAAGNDVPLTDPEGRPLYAEALLAGQHAPGGVDVPLTMLQEVDLAGRLGTLVDDRTLHYNDDAWGKVLVRQPGTVDPPTPPLQTITVDPTATDAQYMGSLRHENAHAQDYWTERTQRGKDVGMRQYSVPDDIVAELHAASQQMRPDLWTRPESWWQRYRERPDELMADAGRMYKENPAEFKRIAPNAAAYIRSQVNDDPLLSQHIQFNVQAGGPMAGLIQVPQEEGLTDADLLQVLGLGPLAPGLMAVAREAGRKATPKVTKASLKDRA